MLNSPTLDNRRPALKKRWWVVLRESDTDLGEHSCNNKQGQFSVSHQNVFQIKESFIIYK